MDEEQNIIHKDSLNMPLSEIKDDVLGYADEYTKNYEDVDIFLWANNLVEYVDEIKIDVYFMNRNLTPFRVKMVGDVAKQLRPIFIDEILEYVLGGAEKGLQVRNFEDAAQEDNVLQKTQIKNVARLIDALNWLKHESANIEEFNDEVHDLSKIKTVAAVVTHKGQKPFYIFKTLPTNQVLRGTSAWSLKDGQFKPFDNMSALRIPSDNQLLAVNQDLFVFNEAKLKSIFGYDAKMAAIAEKKVAELIDTYKLTFEAGVGIQQLLKGKNALIKKLQTVDASLVSQEGLLEYAETMGIEIMTDDQGQIIIMDSKDLTTFVNLLNDDYIESPMTNQRYEIIRKKILKITSSEE